MELQITGTNMEIPPAAQRYIESKFNKLTKHMPDIIVIKVEVSEEDTRSPQQRYMMRAVVNSGVKRAIIHTEERAEDLMQAADKAADVLKRQMEKQKGKLYDRGRGNQTVRGKFVQPEAVETPRKIVKTKSFSIEPMSAEDAIERMEGLRHDFFLYVDERSVEIKLLYRRKDGNYGLIEPVVKMK